MRELGVQESECNNNKWSFQLKVASFLSKTILKLLSLGHQLMEERVQGVSRSPKSTLNKLNYRIFNRGKSFRCLRKRNSVEYCKVKSLNSQLMLRGVHTILHLREQSLLLKVFTTRCIQNSALTQLTNSRVKMLSKTTKESM